MEGLRYSFLANAAGAAAMLAYLGAGGTRLNALCATAALVCFAGGVVTVWVLKFLMLRKCYSLLQALDADFPAPQDDLKTTEPGAGSDDRHPRQGDRAIYCGYLPLACFVGGLLAVGIGLII